MILLPHQLVVKCVLPYNNDEHQFLCFLLYWDGPRDRHLVSTFLGSFRKPFIELLNMEQNRSAVHTTLFRTQEEGREGILGERLPP